MKIDVARACIYNNECYTNHIATKSTLSRWILDYSKQSYQLIIAAVNLNHL